MNEISAARTWHDRPKLAIWLMILSILINTSGAAIEKMLLGTYTVPQLTFMRHLLRLVPLLLVLYKMKQVQAVFVTNYHASHLFRLVAYVSYNFCILYAFTQASMTMVGAFQHITPFFTIALSVLFLKEKMDRNKWISLLITTFGLSFAIRFSSSFKTICLLIVLGCVFGSLNKIMIRKLTATEHSLAITIFGNVAMVLCSIPFLWGNWPTLHWYEMGWFTMSATLMATAQYLAVQALRFGQASLLAPLDCTNIVWSLIFDWCIWQTFPSMYLLTSAAFIIGSNLYLFRSDFSRKVPANML